jgi:Txe/YoeB family toxin of Txe-Axe toxin-antitoxin module
MKKTIGFFIIFLTFYSTNIFAVSQIKVICDKNGEEVYLNGKFKSECDKGEPVALLAKAGRYTVKVIRDNKNGSYYTFKKSFRLGDGVQKVIEADTKITYNQNYYRHTTDIKEMFRYLKEYPNGKYIKSIKQKIDEYIWKNRCYGGIGCCKEYIDKVTWGKHKKEVLLGCSKVMLENFLEDYDLQKNINLKSNDKYTKIIKNIINKSFQINVKNAKGWLREYYGGIYSRKLLTQYNDAIFISYIDNRGSHFVKIDNKGRIVFDKIVSKSTNIYFLFNKGDTFYLIGKNNFFILDANANIKYHKKIKIKEKYLTDFAILNDKIIISANKYTSKGYVGLYLFDLKGNLKDYAYISPVDEKTSYSYASYSVIEAHNNKVTVAINGADNLLILYGFKIVNDKFKVDFDYVNFHIKNYVEFPRAITYKNGKYYVVYTDNRDVYLATVFKSFKKAFNVKLPIQAYSANARFIDDYIFVYGQDNSKNSNGYLAIFNLDGKKLYTMSKKGKKSYSSFVNLLYKDNSFIIRGYEGSRDGACSGAKPWVLKLYFPFLKDQKVIKELNDYKNMVEQRKQLDINGKSDIENLQNANQYLLNHPKGRFVDLALRNYKKFAKKIIQDKLGKTVKILKVYPVKNIKPYMFGNSRNYTKYICVAIVKANRHLYVIGLMKAKGKNSFNYNHVISFIQGNLSVESKKIYPWMKTISNNYSGAVSIFDYGDIMPSNGKFKLQECEKSNCMHHIGEIIK